MKRAAHVLGDATLATRTCDGIIITTRNKWDRHCASSMFLILEVKLAKRGITSSKTGRRTLAAQQHQPVREFLDTTSVLTKLLAGLVEGNKLTLLKELLKRNNPVKSRYMQDEHNMSKAAVSEAADNLDQYLRDFSKQLEPLKARRIVIRIPRTPRQKGGLRVGHHFACFNTKTKKYLDGPATRKLLGNLWKDEIQAKLRNKLADEAQGALSEKLKERNDYQPLDMAIGITEKESLSHNVEETFGPHEARSCDRSRVWRTFDSKALLRPEGCYILSSDVGTGKTTFLRHLQLRLLQKTDWIPIFLAASEIEHWEFKRIDLFLKTIAGHLDLKLDEDKVVTFLENVFGEENIVLLIDGLDQIKGGASQYEPLANKIIELSRGKIIITSRPSAVTALDAKEDITFLRLQPFSTRIQNLYFGKHYGRALELSAHAPDLVAIPMLAYMVRTLIEKGEDKDVKHRSHLYERFICHILTEYRHGESEIPVGLRNKIRVNLQNISYNALAEQEPLAQKIPMTYYAKHYLDRKLSIEAEELTRSGLVNLIVERTTGAGDFLYFTHTSFQEYLAAEWASHNPECLQEILDGMWNPKWKEVIRFLVGIKGQEIIENILSEKDNIIHSKLFLSAVLVPDTEITPALRNRISQQIECLLSREPFKDDAEIYLTYVDELKAIHRFVNKIKDKDRIVVDLAIEDLKRFAPQANGKFVEQLADILSSTGIDLLAMMRRELKRSANDTIVETSADILNISSEVVKEVVNNLEDKDYRVVSSAMLSLGEYKDRDEVDSTVVKKIIKKLEDRNKQVVFSAICALGELKDRDEVDNAVVKKIIKKLKDKNGYIVLSAIRTLGELKDRDAVDSEVVKTIVTKLKDKDYPVAYRAKETLIKLKDKLDDAIVKEIMALKSKGAYLVLKVLYQDGRLESLDV